MKINPSKSIPTKQSSDIQWIEWHKALRQNFGRKAANQLWALAWEKRRTITANTAELRNYMKDNGVNMTGDLGLLSDYADFTAGVSDFFENSFTAGKYIGIAIAVVVIGGAGMLIFNIAKNPATSIGTAAKIALKK